MAQRCRHLTSCGFGLVSRQLRTASQQRGVAAVAFDATTATSSSSYNSSSSSNNNKNSLASSPLQRGWFGIDNRGVPQRRSYSSSSARSKEYAPNPLDAFRDPVDRQTRMQEPVGRQWSVKELRRKSYEDLHRLWYVLYKEKNMLLTEQQLSRRRQLIFPQPDRFQKVQKGMGAIRQVLGERKRKVVAAHLERHREKELAKQMTAELDHQDAEFVEIEESDFGDETEINDKDSTK